MLHETCLRCNRKLKTEESKKLGFGKICWEKHNSDKGLKALFEISKSDESVNSKLPNKIDV